MSMEYVIDADSRLVRVTFRPNLIFDEWRNLMDAVLADPSFRPGFGFLVDLSGLVSAPEMAFVRQAAGYFMAHRNQLGGGRRAVVVNAQSIYGMGRMEEVLAEPSGVPVRPFYRRDEALRWLQTGDE